MTIYELRDYCDDMSFCIEGEEMDVYDLAPLVDPTGELHLDFDDMNEFEVSFISGNKYGGITVDLEESLEDIIDTLRYNYSLGEYAEDDDEDEDDE